MTQKSMPLLNVSHTCFATTGLMLGAYTYSAYMHTGFRRIRLGDQEGRHLVRRLGAATSLLFRVALHVARSGFS